MSVADRLYRRILMMVAPVKITATNDAGPVHRVQVRGFPNETIDAMAVLQTYGLASHAMAGTDGIAVFASGDRSNGVIIATGNQKYRLRNLKAGEVALYTDEGDIIALKRDHNIEITTTGSVTINATDKVRMVTPQLEVTGEIIDRCDEQDHSVSDMRTIYNAHTHRGVQSGSGNSGIPNQPQRAAEDV